jgi:ADP-ribose pyrophosphatase YjhB (NUDIX family)
MGMPDQPQLVSLALMVRDDRKTLFVRHAAGPFAGRWSLPFIGVADVETAEDALERLMRDYLHVEPGPYEFLDTVYLVGQTGERFIANAFTCVDWQGEPRFPAQLFDDALWALPEDMSGLELLPELREWLGSVFPNEVAEPAIPEYDGQGLLDVLADARGELIAAFDAIPHALRAEALNDDGWSPLDVLAHVIDVEAYYRNEVRRCLDEPGRTWLMFNSEEWKDIHALRPEDDEATLRDRMDAVRHETRTWLTYQPPDVLNGYINHPERGVVLAGERISKIASHDQEHAQQLRDMSMAAAMRSALDEGGAGESQS